MKTETQDDTLSVSTFTPLNSTLPLSSTPPSPLKKSQKCKRTTTNLKAEKPTSATNSFTPSQDTEIIKLRNENVKYKAILKIFQDRDGFTGNEKSVKNRYFKVKDEITELGDDDKQQLLKIIHEYQDDKAAVILASFKAVAENKSVTKAFISKFLKEMEGVGGTKLNSKSKLPLKLEVEVGKSENVGKGDDDEVGSMVKVEREGDGKHEYEASDESN